jgi:type IV pilus assembly protein PilV
MKAEKGFSLIEVVIAIVVMAVGLLALSGTLVVGVSLPEYARKRETANRLANAIMENIIAAKETSRPGFNSFNTLSYADAGGRFLTPIGARDSSLGARAILEAGADGVYGTVDDGPLPMRMQLDPGPDGLYTARRHPNDTAWPGDDKTKALAEYTYKVFITDLAVGSKQIEVRVYFLTPSGSADSISLICQLSDYRTL